MCMCMYMSIGALTMIIMYKKKYKNHFDDVIAVIHIRYILM